MDLDRRKHDVDVIERVLGGIRESRSDDHVRVVDVDVDGDDNRHQRLELTIGLDDSESDRSPHR